MNQPTPGFLLHAISFAAQVHQSQLRKDGKTPYAAHPMRVMTIVSRDFGVEDPEVLAAAVLHDVIEDTTADRDDLIEKFGPRVARIVADLSKDTRLPEDERERAYFEALAQAPVEVKLCKLADTIDNLIDSAELTVESRRKAIRKAKELVELFAPGFPDEWRHALDRTRRWCRPGTLSWLCTSAA
jgi:guanosine-3',5'-bis(diphosphate) 3'-pyrophosphohydrolase